MDEPASAAKKISYFFVAIIFILLALSFISLYQAAETYMNYKTADYTTLILSVGAITLSAYLLIQMRKQPMKLGFEPLKVFTAVQCPNCDFKNTREFRNGDFVLKKVEACPKCNTLTFVSSIYREATEEEKAKS
jgi:hypothetical protein